MSFSADLSAFRDKARGRADLVVKKIVIDVSGALVMKSPVGDGKYWKSKPPKGYVGGRFRANWQYNLGSFSTATNNGRNATKHASRDQAAESVGINIGSVKAGAGNVHYITNSLPYSIRLENGWSKNQAPNGMVGITILEFQPIVAAAAKALS